MGAQSRGGKVRKYAAKNKQQGINLQNEVNFQQGNIDTYWKFKAFGEGKSYKGKTGPQITGKHTKTLNQRSGYTQAQRDAGYGSTYDVFTFYNPADTAKKAGYSPTSKSDGSFYMWRYFDYNNQKWKADKKTYQGISARHKTAALEADLGKLAQAKSARAVWEGNPFDASKVKSPNRGNRMANALLDNQSKGITTPNVSKGGTGYRQVAMVDKDTYSWDSGALEVTKGTGEMAIYSYDDGQQNYANPQLVREPTEAEKADIFGAGRDNYLEGIGVSNDKKSNRDIMLGMNATQKKTKAEIKELSGLVSELNYVYKNRTASGNKDKLDKIKAKLKAKFPGINLSGNAKTIAGTVTSRMDKKIKASSVNKAKQDKMSTYISLDSINTGKINKGKAVGYQNQATQKAVNKAKAIEAQKAYDTLWADGGTALMTDSSVNNITPQLQNMTPTNNDGKLVSDVGILKKYDAWDQRHKYIAPALDERKTDLNKYYNSNYLQDFTVSDEDASQSMFGMDKPLGHSLAYSSMDEIGINQKTPRTAIKSINQILTKTSTDRAGYAESLSGIETKLLTLKEQRDLKRKENKAIEADIARQVEADVSGGTVGVNEVFRDKITGTSEELYDLNVQVAEHNVIKDYYDKSISQTDEDVEHLKDRLVEVTKVKNRNDYDTITSSGGDDGGNRSRSSLGGYYKANKFKRSTGGNVQRTRGGRNNLSGLVL